jgi:hypothetical protein
VCILEWSLLSRICRQPSNAIVGRPRGGPIADATTSTKRAQARANRAGLIKAGREGFEPSVELLAPQPLSRRPQSSTLAPPPDNLPDWRVPAPASLFNWCNRLARPPPAPRPQQPISGVAEGEGFEPPETLRPQRFSRPPQSSALPSLRASRPPARLAPGPSQPATRRRV